MKHKPDYEHVKCTCGGIIRMHDRYRYCDACVCEACGKGFKLYELPYNYLKINDKTGWIFPVIMRRVE